MPPYVPRKRLRGNPSKNGLHTEKDSNASTASNVEKRKPTLYDDLDASATPQSSKNSASVLQGLDDDDSGSSLTSLSDEDFEDVPITKRQRIVVSEDSDEDVEFEDVQAPDEPAPDAPVTSDNLELTLIRDTRMSLTNPFGEKKGPSKRERMVRNATHRIHVMLLLWHNAIRNSWLCDQEVQAIMVSHLPLRIWEEVERWRRNSGLVMGDPSDPSPKNKKKRKGRGNERDSRDWSATASKLEEGAVDMSHGDPLLRILKCLCSWWRQRFRIVSPGIRKRGYMSLERLDRLTQSQKAEPHDCERFGERISNRQQFRKCAEECTGSRDVGAQLFTALLRGLGMEARMIANLQTLGFGWSKLEDAEPETAPSRFSSDGGKATKPGQVQGGKGKNVESKSQAVGTSTKVKSVRANRSTRKPSTTPTHDPDELELEYANSDDESVIELQISPSKTLQSKKKFDDDLDYPHYWTEVLSPVTKKYLPVDALVKNIVATNRDLTESLEPRGSKADKARQVMAYIIGYSQDGTAKDVTVRYLKRQMLPGRTKGVRVPIEKVPVYNRHGKVKRYEQLDWFKVALSGYRRGTHQHPITEEDDDEDATDLKPLKPEKKEVKEGEETLQYFKQSKEYILMRHLKREEALQPGAVRAKIFRNKAKGGRVEEEDVYLRKDVVQVKSAETWHKQGRAPQAGERPLKRVPYRAATLNRRREILEAEAATGEKVLQGLYSFDQTDWIIPPPIKDGTIPKNEYGNIDLFAEHMCPEGAVHIPFRGSVRVCKRLQIDYAEAVVDFEFGHRMAVPVIQGVVIAEENHDLVMEELQKDEAERIRKEDEKRRKEVLGKWRKFMMGMRIVERIRQEYGEVDESVSVFSHSRGIQHQSLPDASEGDLAGGFLPEGYEEEDDEGDEKELHHTSSFFPAVDEEDNAGDGGLVMDHGDSATLVVAEPSAKLNIEDNIGTSLPTGRADKKRRAK